MLLARRWEALVRPTGAWRRHVQVITAGMAGLVAVSWVRFALAGTLDLDRGPFNIQVEVTTRVLMAACLLPLAVSYIRLWSEDLPGGAAADLVRSALGLVALATFALPLTSNDVFSNLAYGRMTHLGLDIARLGPNALPVDDPFRAMVTPRWLDSPCVYGPLTTWTFYLATFSGSVWTAFLTYKALFAAVAVAVVLAARWACARVMPGSLQAHGLVLTAFNPLVVWEVAGQGHNDGVMILLAFVSVGLLAGGAPAAAGVVLALAVLTKSALAPALLMLAFFALGRWRERHYAVLCGAAAVAAVSAVGLSPKLAMTVGLGGTDLAIEQRLMNSVSYLVFTLARPFGEAAALVVYRVYWLASVALVGLATLVYGRHARTPDDVRAYSFRLLLLLVLVFSPNLQPWYFTWLVPFALSSRRDALDDFLVVVSMAFFALYPIQQSVPSSLLALGCVYMLLGRLRPAMRWRHSA